MEKNKDPKLTIDVKPVAKKEPVKRVITEEQRRIEEIRAAELVLQEEQIAEAKRISEHADRIRKQRAQEIEIERMKQIIIKEDRERALEKERIKDNEKVTGQFRFHEVPHGMITFPYRKYKKDGIVNYTFTDGGTYTVPLCVAKHINDNVCYPILAHQVDANNKPVIGVGSIYHRASFHRNEFTDGNDLNKKDLNPQLVDMTCGTQLQF